jgi:hypothetical protein
MDFIGLELFRMEKLKWIEIIYHTVMNGLYRLTKNNCLYLDVLAYLEI